MDKGGHLEERLAEKSLWSGNEKLLSKHGDRLEWMKNLIKMVVPIFSLHLFGPLADPPPPTADDVVMIPEEMNIVWRMVECEIHLHKIIKS